MTNLTDVTDEQLQMLKDFATSENKELVAQLEEILEDVAKTGQYIFPWHFLKPLYAHKLDKVTEAFLSSKPPLKSDGTEDEVEVENLNNFRTELLGLFDKFISAPFTIQRVSELLTNPKKHYKSTIKFFRGLEKNILVVSTVDHVPPEQRPVLKRSLVEEIPEADQNGYVETELKPPVKKSVMEEATAVVTDISSNDMNNSTPIQSKTSENADMKDYATTQESLENMLLCNEEVTKDDVKTDPPNIESEPSTEDENIISTTEGAEKTESLSKKTTEVTTEEKPSNSVDTKQQESMKEG